MLDWPRQARLFQSLATTLEAGLRPDNALELAAATAGGAPGRRARLAALRVGGGATLSQALADAGEEALACAVLRAGETAGRLPLLCKQLADTYALRARLRDEIVGRLPYSVLLIHVALIVLPLPWVVRGALPAWSMACGPLLLWGGLAAAALALRLSGRAGLLARLALRRPFSLLCQPALMADAAAVLGAALSAGMLVPDALVLAADACANRLLAERLRSAAEGVRSGRLADLTAALEACGVRGELLELVRTGERSGKLEEGLGHVRVVAAERFSLRLRWTARLITGAVYGLAMLIAVITVFTMYSQVYGNLMHELDSD